MTGEGGAVGSGDLRSRLERLRDILWDAVLEADVAVKAQLAGQLRAVEKDIAALPDAKKVSKADELAARRLAARQHAPASGTDG